MLFRSLIFATSIFFPSISIPCTAASITPHYHVAQQSHLQSLLTKWSHNSIIQPFFQSMPKGGDLHHHITGAVFAETLIDLAASASLCISPITYQLHDVNDCANNSSLIPLTSVYSSSTLYNGIINAWSMRSWVGPSASSPPNQFQMESAHDHFFAIFEKMDLATHAMGTVLAKLRSRAASEHVSYLESMIQIPSASTSILNLYHQFTSTCSYAAQDVQQIWYKMLASSTFQNLLQTVASSLTSYHTYSDTILGCNTTSSDPGCQTVSTWIYYIFRDAECDTVVSQSFFAFALASTFPQLVVGVQLVGPEDGYHARQSFTQQMNLIQIMSGLVNNSVNIALHAGEMTSAMVPPEDLLTHISSSLHIAHAQRVGHMVSILNEPDWQSSLEWMASQKVAVEINLVSNQELLGITGTAHPFPLYLQSSVPCVLSTDDAGIMRTTLTEQFVVAMKRYNLTLATITTLVRNSLEFSFVPGDSLWQKKGDYTTPVSACSTLFTNPSSPSSSCLTYVTQHGTRAALQLRLEQDLFQFGNDMIRMSQKLQRQ